MRKSFFLPLTAYTRRFLDIFLPRPPLLKRIEEMGPEEFSEKCGQFFAPPPFHITALFPYRNPLVCEAIRSLKYHGNQTIARLFASILADEIIDLATDCVLASGAHPPLFIPLPLSRERQHERGWNQTELIANELRKIISKDNCEIRLDILKKIKHTLPQTSLSRKERLKNLHSCFAVSQDKKEYIKNKTIIIFDDVVTTGSTFMEAGKTLKKAGVKEVIAIALAH